jgi:hypothetical protein
MAGYAFEAVVADIKASAAGMTAAAETVGGADPTKDLASVGSALQGGTSAAAATALSTAWTKRFDNWSTAAKNHGAARLSSADRYTHADHEAAMRMLSSSFANRGPMMAQDR